MRLLLLLLCAAAPVAADPTADPLHFSLSVGAGHSHSLLGPRLELSGEHFGGFVAASVSNLIGDPGFAAGIRWTSGDRRGLVLSLHGDIIKDNTGASPQTLTVFAATVGYRFRYERFWLEAAVGPAFYIDSYYTDSEDPGVGRVFHREIGFGAAGGEDSPDIPDLELAIGFEL
jgi:hypothetical protein